MDSWEQGGKYLENKKIDIRMPVTRPNEMNPNNYYTSQNVIDTYHTIMALNTRDDLHYQDYKKLKKIKIAVDKSIYNNTHMKYYLDDYEIPLNNIVFSNSYDECLNLLNDGKVDALVSNVMDFNPDTMKMLDRFYTDSNVIVTRNNADYGYELNEALAKIKLNEITFF